MPNADLLPVRLPCGRVGCATILTFEDEFVDFDDVAAAELISSFIAHLPVACKTTSPTSSGYKSSLIYNISTGNVSTDSPHSESSVQDVRPLAACLTNPEQVSRVRSTRSKMARLVAGAMS